MISGAVSVLLLVAVLVSDGRWQASDPISVSPRWAIVLELQSMGTPFAEYHRRVRRAPGGGVDTREGARVELAANASTLGELCVYRITTPAGRLVLEFADRGGQMFVDLESFRRVETPPSASVRQFVGEFLEASPLTFVSSEPTNRCPYERCLTSA